jgi:nicotinic acid mononucleotide adenylyltransferase
MMTMDFAGAGSQALAWLHSVGGSSRTILEATDRYIPTSLAEAVGHMPEKFTSVETGNALAKHAFERAKKLAKPGTPVFGVGCTATIATDRAKKGDHRCVVSVCDSLGTLSYELVITKGARDRQGEENLVSLLILNAIAEASGVFDIDELPLAQGEKIQRVFLPAPELSKLMSGELNWLLIAPDGSFTTGESLPNLAVLSGSFNPLHEGHKKLSVVASQQLGKDVVFELPLINAEKAPIDLAEARKRAVQFLGFDSLLLSRAPLFDQKAVFYPNSTFILGADTAARLVSPRFYGNTIAGVEESLEHLRSLGATFLVAGRSSKDDFKTLDDIEVPAAYRDMFLEIPEDSFKMDISSTELRKKMAKS